MRRVTVLWEDQQSAQMRSFGPHILLIAAVADVLQKERRLVDDRVTSLARKGNGNVVTELKSNLRRLLNLGAVVAVLDHDRVSDLWRSRRDVAIPMCKTGQLEQLRLDAPGSYEVVFLQENMETLTRAACGAAGGKKPTPDERDRILGRVAWGSTAGRIAIRRDVPSFDRLVRKVADQIALEFENDQ